ncbi:YIR protein [Plasmodium yoelii]|uniref:YIR protein n=1 Tax=Plasmodium yoelii TaxID=5861 RepID=A0A077TWP9_PLAYE|nr:YIR protein [Plasmodium yoelii]
MDYDLCEQFDTLRKYLPDDSSNSTTNDINNLGNIKYYCSNVASEKAECKTDIDKIKAGCLWLFEQLFLEKKKKNINTVEYIIIWLSYKLNQNTYGGINNLNDFYNKHIENNTHYTSCKQGGVDCSSQLNGNTGYTNYKEIIGKRTGLLSTNIGNMSKIYDAFKLLCNIYTEINAKDTQNKKYLENASKFVEKYNELNDPNNTKDEGYYQVLSTLLNDYNNLTIFCDSNGVDCNDIPSLTSSETEESGMQSSEKICNDTPSFSICSLFVLRKRAQKEYLREKLKNIKKRMNH